MVSDASSSAEPPDTTEPPKNDPANYAAWSERLSRAARLDTPGALRYRVNLPSAAISLRFGAAQNGVLVSIKTEVLLISGGAIRGLWAAGAKHEVVSIANTDAVYAPAFSEVFALLPRGRRGWLRSFSHGRVSAIGDGVYLLDASTIRRLAADGTDEWYTEVDQARQLKGPFSCDAGILVQGTRGLSSEAVRIGPRGDVGRRIELPRGAVLLGASPTCEPLVWSDGRVVQLDARGRSVWGRSTAQMPLCTALPRGAAFVAARGEQRALYELIDPRGQTLSSLELPVEGRLTAGWVAPSPTGVGRAIGLCMDVTSPCARKDWGRGPYNALVSLGQDGSVNPLFKHITGHIGFVALPDGRLITASSIDEDTTSVIVRDASDAVLWQAPLAGRMSAGPVVGENTVYVATCAGLACDPPHTLFALTLERLPETTDATHGSAHAKPD